MRLEKLRAALASAQVEVDEVESFLKGTWGTVFNSQQQQAAAWQAVWSKMTASNPDFYPRGLSGKEAALQELGRLYDLEKGLVQALQGRLK